jgi:hypothetical protein
MQKRKKPMAKLCFIDLGAYIKHNIFLQSQNSQVELGLLHPFWLTSMLLMRMPSLLRKDPRNSVPIYFDHLQVVTKVVFALSSGAIFTWLYPEKPSIKEYVELRAALSTKTSICGRGKSSLGLALRTL